MIKHIYPGFLENVTEYRLSEEYWLEIWKRVDQSAREKYNWTFPWVSTGAPDYLDGNPIFSAYSNVLRRGIRLIQYEPTSTKMEIQAWPDFVGGGFADPAAISELAISCALSEESALTALDMMSQWVGGESVALENRGGSLLPRPRMHSGETIKVPLESAA